MHLWMQDLVTLQQLSYLLKEMLELGLWHEYDISNAIHKTVRQSSCLNHLENSYWIDCL